MALLVDSLTIKVPRQNAALKRAIAGRTHPQVRGGLRRNKTASLTNQKLPTPVPLQSGERGCRERNMKNKSPQVLPKLVYTSWKILRTKEHTGKAHREKISATTQSSSKGGDVLIGILLCPSSSFEGRTIHYKVK